MLQAFVTTDAPISIGVTKLAAADTQIKAITTIPNNFFVAERRLNEFVVNVNGHLFSLRLIQRITLANADENIIKANKLIFKVNVSYSLQKFTKFSLASVSDKLEATL